MNLLIFLIMMILSWICILRRTWYVGIHILLLATLKYFWDIATLSITGKKSNFWSHVIYHPKVLNKTFILGSYPPTMRAVNQMVYFPCHLAGCKHTNLYVPSLQIMVWNIFKRCNFNPFFTFGVFFRFILKQIYKIFSNDFWLGIRKKNKT